MKYIYVIVFWIKVFVKAVCIIDIFFDLSEAKKLPFTFLEPQILFLITVIVPENCLLFVIFVCDILVYMYICIYTYWTVYRYLKEVYFFLWWGHWRILGFIYFDLSNYFSLYHSVFFSNKKEEKFINELSIVHIWYFQQISTHKIVWLHTIMQYSILLLKSLRISAHYQTSIYLKWILNNFSYKQNIGLIYVSLIIPINWFWDFPCIVLVWKQIHIVCPQWTIIILLLLYYLM